LWYESEPVLTGNTIEGNSVSDSTWGGGGLQINHCSPVLRDNVIRDNAVTGQGGGLHIMNCLGTLEDNMISENIGSGMYCSTSYLEFVGNTVASNTGSGLEIWNGGRVAILSNAIAANTGLGIDLGGDGVTLNDLGDESNPPDTDLGPNGLQNFPVILSATSDATGTTVDGYLLSSPDTVFTVDFYANTEADPSGYGEGETPIGSTTVTTDADGLGVFLVTFPVAAQRAALTTATATGPEGNTSEFSAIYVTVVGIDIKPGSDPNSINLGAEGVVPVAVLGTPDFDASTVDASSLFLSGSAVRLKGKSGNAGSLEDVDGDGDLDLVVQFYIDQLALEEGATEAALAGTLLDGTPIVGYDSVRVVPAQ
jgi:hypothetical protein